MICQRDGCGASFEPDPGLSPGATQQRYCTKACRAMARQDRVTARLGPCKACGSTDRVTTNLGLVLCQPCQAVVHLSCHRKIQYPTANAAEVTIGGKVLLAYECRICGHFHATNATGVPDGWPERVALIAAYIRSIGFDVNEARGWTNVRPKESVDA